MYSREGCTSSINRDHPGLDANGERLNACMTLTTPPTTSPLLSTTGTLQATLVGASTVSFNGSSDNVAVTSGVINMAVPKTDCNAEDNSCLVQLNRVALEFEDFPLAGHAVSKLTVVNNGVDLTAPGFFDPGSGLFLFTIPAGISFDATAAVDGASQGLPVTSTVGVSGSFNPTTGAVTFAFQFVGDFQGSQFSASGVVMQSQVIALAPVLTVAGPLSVDATTSCSANVTLSASAISPVGLPVTIDYAVESGFLGSGPSVTTTLPVGTHNAVITASDSNGQQDFGTQSITVNDRTAPVFGNVEPSVTVNTCNLGATSVPITAPTAQNACAGGAVTVTGRVITFNGAAVSIPVVNGTVSVPPGSGTIEFTATGANGVTSRVTQTLTVVGPAAVYGQRGVSIADGSSVTGTIYTGTGGQVVLGNDVTVGNVFSLSPVLLRDRVTTGLIQTNAGVTQGNNDHIADILNTVPTLPAFPQLAAVINGSQSIVVNPDATRTLAPGRYANVTVFSRGKLILSTGNYEFTSLDLEPQASLIVPSASVETAKLLVKTSVIYRGRTTVQSGATAPLYLGYTGTGAFFVESPPFTGTLVSPNAALNLQSLNGAGSYRGEFFAKNVNLGPHTAIVSVPFTCH